MIDDDYDDDDSFGVGEFGIGGRQQTPHGWRFFRCHDRGCWRRWRRFRPFCSDAVAAAFVVVVFVVARPLSSGRVSSLTLSLVTTVGLLMLNDDDDDYFGVGALAGFGEERGLLSTAGAVSLSCSWLLVSLAPVYCWKHVGAPGRIILVSLSRGAALT